MLVYVVMAVIAYLIGSLNISIFISKKMAGFDVREKGSKSTGATNVLRTVGKKAAAITLVFDALKGVISILIALLVSLFAKEQSQAILIEVAAFFAVLGHTFPIYYGFKGGKGVATSLGIILLVNWKIGLICLIFALLIMAITRMVSLGSISAAVLFAVLILFIRDSYIVNFEFNFIIFGILLAVLVIFNHRTNLKRIISGTENKLNFSKKESSVENDDKSDENKVEKEENSESIEKEHTEDENKD